MTTFINLELVVNERYNKIVDKLRRNIMAQMTIEREFNAYKAKHMISVLSAYMINKASKDVCIPSFINKDLQDDIQTTIRTSLEDGSFKDKYEVAWDSMKELLP